MSDDSDVSPEKYLRDPFAKSRSPAMPSKKEEILKLLDEIDGLAADSRGCYDNARGNDRACYEATEKIRKLLDEEISDAK